ncbi:MAG: hypothetical protein LBL04_06240 [Bacteroidales bacterium]|jgi:hypothetical protein|nr:hypothetical protein [Bacteroidales bacterium]
MRKLVNELRWTRYVKSAFAIMLVVLVGALSSGCEKDEKKDPEPGNNEFAYAGQKTGVVKAEQVYAVVEGLDVLYIYFYLENDHVLTFATLQDEELAAGKYVYPVSLVLGMIFDYDSRETLYMLKSGGTVNVDLSGSKYTFDVEGTLTEEGSSKEKSLKGNYSGSLPWREGKATSEASKATSSSDFSDKVQLKEALINRLKENASRIQ